MRYEEFEPTPDLSDVVNSYWSFSVPEDTPMPFDHRVVPDGMISLAYIRSRYFEAVSYVGPRTEAFNPPTRPGDSVWGIRFQPGAVRGLFGVLPAVLRDQHGDARTVFPDFAGTLFDRLKTVSGPEAAAGLFDEMLLKAVKEKGFRPDPLTPAIWRVGETDQTVSAIAAAAGLSERQFRRRFIELVGLTPKEFARIRRLRRSAIKMVEDSLGWAAIAAESGYADQAHLSRDYTRMMGVTPTSLAERLARIRHGEILS